MTRHAGGRLVQILLPLYGREGRRIPRAIFSRTAEELSARFGGMTAYRPAPAEGFWQSCFLIGFRLIIP